MAKGNYSGISCINEHIVNTYKRSKEETSSKYRGVLYQINADLQQSGYSTNPREFDEETIEFLLGLWKERDLAVSTKNWYLHILRRYLAYFQNDVVEQMGVDFGQDVRPNVNWLSDEQAELLMNMEKTPLEEVVIHLELCLGLRIVEVCRLRLSDIHFDEDPRKCYVSVRGKGKGDGKWRSIPFHPDSKEVFERWIARRNEIIDRMHEFDPLVEGPRGVPDLVPLRELPFSRTLHRERPQPRPCSYPQGPRPCRIRVLQPHPQEDLRPHPLPCWHPDRDDLQALRPRRRQDDHPLPRNRPRRHGLRTGQDVRVPVLQEIIR